MAMASGGMAQESGEAADEQTERAEESSDAEKEVSSSESAETESSKEDAASDAKASSREDASSKEKTTSEEDATEETDTSDEASESAETDSDGESSGFVAGSSSMRPGDIDMTGALGLAGLIYVNFEPGVDIGVVPLGEGTTLSVGGTVGLGYCLFCAAVSGLVNDFSVGAWNFSPKVRGLVHFDALGRELDAPLDTYAGASLGTGTYFFNVQSNGTSVSESITTFLFTPLVGGRLFPTESSPLFFFGELRYRIEAGFSKVTLQSEQWQQDFVLNADYGQTGLEAVVGGGLRF
jgi:hypothetical protein